MADVERGVWEETGKTVSMGRLEPLKVVKKFPAYVGFWAAFGAGAIWASLAQGSGELIWWPYLVAKYGPAFIGIVLPACLMQYWVNLEIIRYTTTTGETIFTGFARISRAYIVFMWLMLIIATAWYGGYASAGGTALAALTDFPKGWTLRGQTLFWAYLTIVIFFLALTLSKVVYQTVEWFMEVVVIICIVGLLFAVFEGEVIAKMPSFFGYFFNPFSSHMPAKWDPKDADILLTGICFAGMGGFFNLMYSYWVRDKGFGIARYAGRVTSPITGKAETIPATGFAFEDNPENKAQYKKWMRHLHYDNVVAIAVNTLTLMLMMLLAWALLTPKGLVPKGWEIAVVQSKFFEVSWGVFGKALFLLVAAAFLVDSWLGNTDAISRMHTDFFYSNFAWAKKLSIRAWYYIFVVILTVVTCSTMLLAAPGTLLLAGGILNFIAMAIYCPFLIYLNYYKIPKIYPSWTRPKSATLVIMTIVTVAYIVLAVIYLLFRIFGVRFLL